jgi:hypothetical protein
MILESFARIFWKRFGSICFQKFFFGLQYKDLGEITVEKLLCLKKNEEKSLLFFNYVIYDWIDVRHFFYFLHVKSESLFWPFLLCNYKIVNLIFYNQYCPMIRCCDSHFFVLRSKEILHNHPFSISKYNNLEWMLIDGNDLFRFIHVKFVEPIYLHLITFVEKCEFTCHYQDCNHFENGNLAQSCKLWKQICTFIKFWDDEHQVLQSIYKTHGCHLQSSLNNCTTFDRSHKIFKLLVEKRHESWNKLSFL